MEKLKIWIVEDDFAYQEILKTYLSVLGYSANSFTNGEACLEFIQEEPDVILLDHNLGEGMNGVETLQKIKQECPDTHVVYISGEEKVSLVTDAYRYGSDEFITKDSASLLRLKLILEKILNTKMQQVASRTKLKIRLLFVIVSLAVVVFTYLLIWT
jgi:DNA-binding NtrC family response regulator